MSATLTGTRQGLGPILIAIARHPLVLMAVGVVFVIAALAVTSAAASGLKLLFGKGPLVRLAAAAITAAAGVAAYWLFVRAVERGSFTDFARAGWGKELAFGLLTGFGLMGASVGMIALLGGYEITAFRSPAVLAPALASAIIASVTEEIVTRGIVFRFVEMASGSWVALIVSAAFFGVLHMGNPNSSWLASAAIALEAGVMLAAIYMVTRRLWAAIGIHAGWNFSQAGIFGVPVSGVKMPGLLEANIQGHELLTGGNFGAEASVPAIILCSLAGIVFLWIAHKRRRFVAFSWARLIRPCPIASEQS